MRLFHVFAALAAGMTALTPVADAQIQYFVTDVYLTASPGPPWQLEGYSYIGYPYGSGPYPIATEAQLGPGALADSFCSTDGDGDGSCDVSVGNVYANVEVFVSQPGDYVLTGLYFWDEWLAEDWEQIGEAYYDVDVQETPTVSLIGNSTLADGASGEIQASTAGGDPVSYYWWYNYPPGAGDSPNPPLDTTWNWYVDINGAHWFSADGSTCASNSSLYEIDVNVTFDNLGMVNANTSLTVQIPNKAGDTSAPYISGNQPVVTCQNNVCSVADKTNNTLSRAQAKTTIYVLPTGQFYAKATVHENVHQAQFGPMGMFGNLWDPTVAWNRVKDLTDSTQSALWADINNALGAYAVECSNTYTAGIGAAEQAAHNASDPMPPQYFYQLGCGQQ